jgi:hypothetical protein
MIDVGDIVEDPDFAETLVVRRTTGAYDEYGRWSSNTPTEFDVKGSWQRVSAKELVQVGIGEIKQEVRKLLTTTSMLISESDANLSDRIIDGSDRYKVIYIDDNSNFGFVRSYAAFEGTES